MAEAEILSFYNLHGLKEEDNEELSDIKYRVNLRS
jgi:hypothetical protein